ncbi:hypothetical protein M2262_004071 [Pseudomonas sp. BIGb0408]|uniref:Uncharacterized protein n=1 Tax=Phytopseudomonas flavescens TaxID=29435 RepID=A0A7Y9XJY2_9GAMM|nr:MULTISPECIES: hypothetical protein [Pseudomonas]MCW2294021.1 hypothetical protein [Pseudomonas sp. BIGb0408]NYH71409.1 hypothetical protein [Pseudomonas flavescens]
MKMIRKYGFIFFIPVFYIAGVFATIYVARIFAVSYCLGINHFDFIKEAVRAGELGLKVGGLIALITCACIIFDRYKKKGC